MDLSVSSFLRCYMFHPEKLPDQQRSSALVMSIVLGILTVGLCHLIARITLYDRNVKAIDRSQTSNIHTIHTIEAVQQKVLQMSSDKSSVITKVKTGPAELVELWNDKDFQKKFNGFKSLSQVIYEWNLKQVDEWFAKSKTEQMQLLESRRSELNDGEKDLLECERQRSRSQYGATGSDEEIEHQIFNMDMELMRDLRSKPTEFHLFTQQQGQEPTAMHAMLGLIVPDSSEIAEFVKMKLHQVVRGGKIEIEWYSNAKEFCDHVDPLLGLSENEYHLMKKFFNERTDALERDFQITKRIAANPDFAKRVLQLSLKDLIRATVVCLKLMTDVERDQIIDTVSAKEIMQLSKQQIRNIDKSKLTPSRKRILKSHHMI